MSENLIVQKLETMIAASGSLQSTHITLYVVLLNCWYRNELENPVRITRKNIMQLSHIRSIVTYHKCIRELTNLGVIDYSPSYNKYRATLVSIK
jgi:hypothetical protein